MKGLLRSTVIVSVCTGLSRSLGFVREMLMAWFFGTTLAKSAFDVAFRIPNLFRSLFGEGALSAALVPVFTETFEREGLLAANRLASRAMTLLGVALGLVTLGGLALVYGVLHGFAVGPRMVMVLSLLRIMWPYLFFICLVALCMAVLNSFHHFLTSAATPVLLNVVWIVTMLLICPRLGDSPETQIYGAAWGTLLAGFIQLAVQFPALRRHGIRPRFEFAPRDAQVRRVLLLMGPAVLGMGVHQINVLVDGFMALWVGEWAPAALTYAERLIYLPLGVFATALSTVLLPTFARQAARGDLDGLRVTLSGGLRHLMVLMMPAAIGLIALAGPIVELAFEWRGGVFTETSRLVTARALMCYAPGLVVFSLYKVLVPVFYALQDTRLPMRVGLYAVVLNFFMNLLFILTWAPLWRHAGLACSTVLASAANSLVLAWVARRRLGALGARRILRSLAGTLVAALAMGLAAARAHGPLRALADQALGTGKPAQVAAILAAMALAGLLYVAMLWLCNRSDALEVVRLVRDRRAARRRA